MGLSVEVWTRSIIPDEEKHDPMRYDLYPPHAEEKHFSTFESDFHTF